jgi:hypothetical protein
MSHLVFTSLFLLSCGSEKNEQEECMENLDYGYWSQETSASSFGYFQEITEVDTQAVSFHIQGEQNGSIMWRVAAHFNLHNYADTDCPVLIYRSETAPDFSQITPVSAEVIPDEADENLGILQFAVNLAHSGDYVITEFEGQSWTQQMDFYLTVVTCAEPRLYNPNQDDYASSYYQFDFIGCDEIYEEDDEPVIYEIESRTPEGFSVEILLPE